MKINLIVLFLISHLLIVAQISNFKDVEFTKAENLVKINEGSSIDNLPLLTHKLTHSLSTDIEKFRAIYLWVCHNIKGDYYQHNLVNRKREKFKNDSLGFIAWNNTYKKIAFKKLREQKKTMCTGYAYLIKEMAFIAGIECEIVDGYARSFETNVNELESFNHSWNAVWLNNKWYLCDATWSSGYMLNGNIFIKDYNDGYFLTDPVLFAKNHFPIKKKWFLNDSLKQKTFTPEPIVYGETFVHQVIPMTPQPLYSDVIKNDEITFTFKALNEIDIKDVSLVQVLGKNHRTFKIYDLKNEDGTISFNYKFKQKGTFDLHLKIKNDIVASYNFKVKKS